MKTGFLKALLITALFYPAIHAAQTPAPPEKPEPQREEIEALKIGFITRRLNLTSEEARNFWPVYNKYQDELETIRKQRRNELREIRQKEDGLSDKDAERIIDNEIISRQKELDLMKSYHAQFKKILPVKKVGIL
jgi:hypothetical protein